jgi:ubiquinone/menaquinone biosynthesis C-methylase UbiE
MGGREESKEQQKKWDETYGNMDFFGVEPSELGQSAIRLFHENAVETVLELGCGQGRDTWAFVKSGLKVIALDYSATGICQMIDKARTQGVENRIELKVQDLRQGIPLPDSSVDAVFSHMLLCMELQVKEIQFILDECRRVLRPSGLNVFSVRNDHDPHYGKFVPKGEDMWQNPMGLVVHFFSEEKVRKLSKGYEVVRIREFDDTSPPFVKKLYEVVLRKP